MRFKQYEVGNFFDEMFSAEGCPRPAAQALLKTIESLPDGELLTRQQAAERALLQMGITFNVYGEDAGVEKIFPFDILPRIVSAQEWNRIEAGLKQRIRALNLFIDDIYHQQRILKDGILPKELIFSAKSYRQQCVGWNPPAGIWCHITGTDLVRHDDGQVYVLEDNLRCPSGVSYVLENRQIMKTLFPRLFASSRIRPVSNYPLKLRDMLESLAPEHLKKPRVVLLSPGIFNSAYFEHSFLAQQMGIELVEGRDLVVQDDQVVMRTTKGFERVDVIYRRFVVDFIDLQSFLVQSVLGEGGLMLTYKNGRVAF